MDQHRGVRRTALATGVTVSHVSTGSDTGTPVLLLHAWGEARGSFDRLLPLLPSTVLAIAVDQRGHGDATQAEVGYSLEGLAADIDAFMEARDLPSAVLVGSSSGGYVAQQVAATFPHRVTGLVLLGSPRDLRGRPAFADEVDRLTDPVDPAWVRESLTWFPRLHHVPRWYLEDRVRDGARLPAHVWRAALNGLLTSRPPTDVATITAPTLIVWGDQDGLLARADEEAMSRAIPGSRLVVYEDTGHLVLWEQPERVARDLVTFLDGLG